MKTINVELRGLQPLLMHNPRGVDPTDPLVIQKKTLTDKPAKKKTPDDLLQIDWLDYQLSIYHNDSIGAYVPDVAVVGVIRAGATEQRNGTKVQAGVDVSETEVPLIYDGPRTIRDLYEQRFADRRPVGVNDARVMRVRPRFNQWELRFRLFVDESVIDPGKVREATELAGLRKGLLDYRPRFGRFEVTAWTLV
jgi:hypothetical protein